jgi:hypothetical protein
MSGAGESKRQHYYYWTAGYQHQRVRTTPEWKYNTW